MEDNSKTVKKMVERNFNLQEIVKNMSISGIEESISEYLAFFRIFNEYAKNDRFFSEFSILLNEKLIRNEC